jgi:hypothetical protein
MPWVRYQRFCKTPSVLEAEGVFFALNSKIGFIPQRAYFHVPASKGSLLSRSTKSTVWPCHAPEGAWRLKKEEL